MSDKVNTSGYTCSHYETEMERLARTNKKMKQRIAELESENATLKTDDMMRFYCPSCERYVPDSGVQLKRIMPDTKPPWPLFEYMDKPVCPVCREDLVDTKWVKTDLQSVFGKEAT